MHKSLIIAGVRWLKSRSSIVFSEFATANNETPDAIGWRQDFSTLIECKASRSDFLADAKKFYRRYPDMGIGKFRYYLCPSGLLHLEDLPEKWGLLWAHKRGITIKRPSDYFNHDPGAEIRFLVSMLRRTQVRLGEQPLADWLRWDGVGKPGHYENESGANQKGGRTP